MRDGTDSVFVRLSEGDQQGYGEATIPPYLEQSQTSVFQELIAIDLDLFIKWLESGKVPSFEALGNLSAPARAALTTAYFDLTAQRVGKPAREVLGINPTSVRESLAMFTIGHAQPTELPSRLAALPRTGVLKIKLGSVNDRLVLEAVKQLDARKLFFDANQGWTDPEQALEAIAIVGKERVRGIEQPFAKDRWDLHKELKSRTEVPVFGDESIQGLSDLDRAAGSFSGVNLKLMKCGGLDIARDMALKARELGLEVMLGSMSESSLGCAAMAALAGYADLLDLDGPWLIRNDPFQGIGIENGILKVEGNSGIGIVPRYGSELDWFVVSK